MPQVIEQPEDWTQPGAYAVAPGVYRVPLPLPLNGLSAVNAYLLEGPDGLILIDPGWACAETEKAVSAALAELGHRLDDVTLCLATHQHWDHYSQAAVWRRTRGFRVLIGAHERTSLEDFEAQVWPGRFPHHVDILVRCGAPDLAHELAVTPLSDEEARLRPGLPDGWLEDGEQIPLRDGGALEVVATPGHTRGHIVFHHRAAELLFSGDHILPTITPSIGFEWSPAPHPLRSFLRSLRLVRELPDATLVSSHGPVTASTHERVDQLLDHHRHRLDEVCDEVASGNATAYQVARALPWTRRSTRLDDLPIEHQLSAITEINAHLDVLTMLGRVTRDDLTPATTYALAS